MSNVNSVYQFEEVFAPFLYHLLPIWKCVIAIKKVHKMTHIQCTLLWGDKTCKPSNMQKLPK